MNDRVLVVVASRHRNLALQTLIETFLATRTGFADLAVYIDEDQERDYGFQIECKEIKAVVGPQVGPCKSLNHLIEQFPDYAAYGAATDDAEFVTPNWDQWALTTAKLFPGEVGAFHPYLYDAHYGQRMDFPWVTGRWIETLGWFCHPAAHHFYWDILIELLAEQVGIVRAGEDQFAMRHIGAETPDVRLKTLTDARNLVPVIGIERHGLIKKLKEAQCQARQLTS